MIRKDKDTMRDTGGRYRHKDLKKPSRLDRKKPSVDRNDPDFKDTKRDEDLKRERIARELLAMVKELLAE